MGAHDVLALEFSFFKVKRPVVSIGYAIRTVVVSVHQGRFLWLGRQFAQQQVDKLLMGFRVISAAKVLIEGGSHEDGRLSPEYSLNSHGRAKGYDFVCSLQQGIGA